MNKALRNLAFVSIFLLAPVCLSAQAAPPQGAPAQGAPAQGTPQGAPTPQAGGGAQDGGFGGGRGQGQGRSGNGRGRGAFVPTGPAGALAGRPDIYTSANGTNTVGKATSAGEHFFIIGSVDQAQQQILLKWPTEVTLLLKVTPTTKFASESGQALKFSDFRAGDTVWVTYSGSGDNATAVHVRAGVMSVDDLHKYYLDYAVIK